MKQSVINITENFQHLLKDAIATIKPDVNLNKGNSDLTCMNCTANEHMQDKGKAILIEQVNAGNKMTNFGNNSGQQGFGIHQSSEMKSSNPEGVDGEFFQDMNTRIPSGPRYTLRKRTHPQLQQHDILFLIQKFEKLTIH